LDPRKLLLVISSRSGNSGGGRLGESLTLLAVPLDFDLGSSVTEVVELNWLLEARVSLEN